jgi:hypothetical protein
MCWCWLWSQIEFHCVTLSFRRAVNGNGEEKPPSNRVVSNILTYFLYLQIFLPLSKTHKKISNEKEALNIQGKTTYLGMSVSLFP